jgi:putative FmdB family regulatory protein
MPTYEYECGACSHTFERFQPITARPIRICPACGQRQVRRLIGTGGGVIFRGSGFYQTDYRSESYKKAAKAESDRGSGASKKDDKGSTKSDAAAAKGSSGSKSKGASSSGGD